MNPDVESVNPAAASGPAPGPGPAPAADLSSVAGVPGVPKPNPILVVRSYQKSFGALKVVDVEHLEIQRHAVTALIGPNGAGKTTLFNLITGTEAADSGECTFNQKRITGRRNWQIARQGVVRTFQHTRALTKLTVLENMLLAAPDQSGEKLLRSCGWVWRGQDASNKGRAMDLLDRFSLAHMADQYAGILSGGQRKLLEMARALMAEPEVIMLDEPLAGVNPVLAEEILGHIRQVCAGGTTVVFIEHDMPAVKAVSDWVICMAEGRVIAEGTHAQVGQDPLVLEAYLGGSISDLSADAPEPSAPNPSAPDPSAPNPSAPPSAPDQSN